MTTTPPEDKTMQSTAPVVTSDEEKESPMEVAIPEAFSSYAATPSGDGSLCTTGAVTDEDGMNQRPLAYLKDSTGQVRWVRVIPLSANTFQARATGCLKWGSSLYVLLQSDTQSEQTLSQTLLSVAELSAQDGALKRSYDVAVPNFTDAYSAWVDENGGFRLANSKLIINGLYFRLDDPERRRPFETVLDINQ